MGEDEDFEYEYEDVEDDDFEYEYEEVDWDEEPEKIMNNLFSKR